MNNKPHIIQTTSTADILIDVDAAVFHCHSAWIVWGLKKFHSIPGACHLSSEKMSFMKFVRGRAELDDELMEKFGKTIYADGVFDLFHTGHLDFINKVRNLDLCKKLVIGIMSDAAVESYKRVPILPAVTRGEIVAAIDVVDEVIVDAPFMHEFTVDFLDSQQIDIVAYGGDPKLDGDSKDALGVWYDHYKVAIERDIVCMVGYSNRNSTSGIIEVVRTGGTLSPIRETSQLVAI